MFPHVRKLCEQIKQYVLLTGQNSVIRAHFVGHLKIAVGYIFSLKEGIMHLSICRHEQSCIILLLLLLIATMSYVRYILVNNLLCKLVNLVLPLSPKKCHSSFVLSQTILSRTILYGKVPIFVIPSKHYWINHEIFFHGIPIWFHKCWYHSL